MAPATCDVAQRARRPSSGTSRTTPALSMAGSVLGMATTAVKPPSAAARDAGLDRLGLLPAGLAQVGVEVDQPGRDDAAAGVEHVERRRARRAARPTATMRPPSTRPRRPGARPVASTTVPPRMTTSRRRDLSRAASPSCTPAPSSRNRTAMRTATPLATWLGDHGAGQVGHLGGDLDAPVHRAGVHDEGVVRAAAAARSA